MGWSKSMYGFHADLSEKNMHTHESSWVAVLNKMSWEGSSHLEFCGYSRGKQRSQQKFGDLIILTNGSHCLKFWSVGAICWSIYALKGTITFWSFVGKAQINKEVVEIWWFDYINQQESLYGILLYGSNLLVYLPREDPSYFCKQFRYCQWTNQ